MHRSFLIVGFSLKSVGRYLPSKLSWHFSDFMEDIIYARKKSGEIQVFSRDGFMFTKRRVLNFASFFGGGTHLLGKWTYSIMQWRKDIFGIFFICNTSIENVKVGYKSMWKVESYFHIFKNWLVFESKDCHQKHKLFECSN